MASIAPRTVTIRVPGDKSISHRALMLAALGDGVSRVTDILDSADVRSTAGALRAMGARIPAFGADMSIRGVGLGGLVAPTAPLDCGNSGTTTRLLAGVVAGSPFARNNAVTFEGDASLSRRPMQRVARPLGAMGASFEFLAGDGLPMRVRGGALQSIEWDNSASSAQVKSAILLAGLTGRVPVTVREPRPSRDHTERMLRARDVSVVRAGDAVTLTPVEHLAAGDAAVPADPSSAAFFAALAALMPSLTIRLPDVCLNPTRTGFLDALGRMGARIEYEEERTQGGEPVGTVIVTSRELHGIRVGAHEVPSMIDELPLLACLAAVADGETVIEGAGELRVKESDRIGAVVANLRALGADAEEQPEGMRIVGRPEALSGRVETHGDHRLAMAFGILGARSGHGITVDDPECVAVSYPEFWTDLRRAVP